MTDICSFAEVYVLPRLNSGERLQQVVESAKSVIKLILKQLGHQLQDLSDFMLQECFRVVKKNTGRLADWIVHAVQEGLSSLNQYLRSHPTCVELYSNCFLLEIYSDDELRPSEIYSIRNIFTRKLSRRKRLNTVCGIASNKAY